MKKHLLLFLPLCVLLVISACVPFLTSGSWRYRMTVEVETPEGIKSGSAVREVHVTESPDLTPEMMASVKVKGEAVVVDLGERGVLFALLRDENSPSHAHHVVYKAFPYAGGAHTPAGIRHYRGLEDVRKELPPKHWPMFVTFRDMRDPTSVEKVEADNLTAQFGEGVRIKRVIMEMTEDKVTWDVAGWLRWLPARKNMKGALGSSPEQPLYDPTGLYLKGVDFSKGRYW